MYPTACEHKEPTKSSTQAHKNNIKNMISVTLRLVCRHTVHISYIETPRSFKWCILSRAALCSVTLWNLANITLAQHPKSDWQLPTKTHKTTASASARPSDPHPPPSSLSASLWSCVWRFAEWTPVVDVDVCVSRSSWTSSWCGTGPLTWQTTASQPPNTWGWIQPLPWLY